MSSMSQEKNFNRWKPTSSIKLRKGQKQVLDILNNPKHDCYKTKELKVELPTGYGKTFVICAAYATLKDLGYVDRALIVVPSDEQFKSYLNDIEADMKKMGAKITAAVPAHSDFGLKMHFKNQAEIFVTTIQSLSVRENNQRIAYDYIPKGKWLLALDEFHRLKKESKWGEAIKDITPVNFTLAVSATPNRTDRADKVIDGDIDVKISLTEALDEGAIRPVAVYSSGYTLDISFGGENEPQRFTTKQLIDELNIKGKDISSAEVKKELRYYPKYLNKILLDAMAQLDNLQLLKPKEHKMLVFGMGVSHAKLICDQINKISDKKRADWIGVQSTVKKDDDTSFQIGRSDKVNNQVIENFKKGEIDVLVQVRKAAEGFNDVKCSVLLFLNLVGDSVLLRQMIGRGLRRNYNVEVDNGQRAIEDRCYIYVSDDHPGLDYIKTLEDQSYIEANKKEIKEREQSDKVRIYNIPDFYLLSADKTSEEIHYPCGSLNKIKEDMKQHAKNNNLNLIENIPDKDLNKYFKSFMETEYNMKPTVLSTNQQREECKKKVDNATSLLAQSVAKIKYNHSQTIVGSIIGDHKKVINQRWIRVERIRHSEMTIQDFERKYKWIKSISDDLNNSSDLADQLSKLRYEYSWLNL